MKLEIGNNSSFEIRKENYFFKTKSPISILYLSDFHFNRWSSKIVETILENIERLNPCILLLGGDYADTKQGLVHFNSFMQAISRRKNIYAIAGNHDYFIGVDKVQRIITDNNGIWIEKKSVHLMINDTQIQIDGNCFQKLNESNLNILCLHKPVEIDNTHYNLAFAGHLHGGQLVLWTSKKGLYPARFFYKWNKLKHTFCKTSFFISKGLGDTLPVRYNCKKDIIFVKITSK